MNLRMWAVALALALSTGVMDAADWVNLGPGSPITAFAVDRFHPGTLYAARGDPSGLPPDSPGHRSTIFKTTDRGAHWTQVLTASSTITALAIDPADPTRVWALQGTSRPSIYRSTAAGANWTAGPPFDQIVRSLAVSEDGTVLYAGGSFFAEHFSWYGCFFTSYTRGNRSLDGGMTWTSEAVGPINTLYSDWPGCQPLPPSPAIEILAFDAFDSNRILAVAGGTLFRRSAEAAWAPYFTPGCVVTALATSPVLPGQVRLGFQPGAIPSPCNLLLDSADGGQTFAPAPSPVPAGTDGSVEALAFNPTDANVAYVAVVVFSATIGSTGHFIFSTADGGRSWHGLDWPDSLPVRALALDADGWTLYASSDTGIFASEIGPARRVPRAVPFRR